MTYNFAGFNPEEHKDEFEPVPVGRYNVIITEAMMEQTSDGLGQFLKLTEQITGPTCAGMNVTERLNLINSNAQAVSIAETTLAKIIKACGLVGIQSENDLLNKSLMIDVEIVPAKPYVDKKTGENKPGFPQNKIKYLIPEAGQQPVQQQQQAQPAQQQQQQQQQMQGQQNQQQMQQNQQQPAQPSWKQNA